MEYYRINNRLHHKYTQGFSLVELSIIMVILGLLVMGILGGSALIRQAELRTIIAEVDTHISRAKIFYQKYGYYPGDMPNASQFWQDGGNCPPGNAPVGCNGDGDQHLSDNLENTSAELAEKYRAWQHLALAGMIDGSFTGIPVSGSNNGGDSSNSPSSVRQGGLYYFVWDSFFGFLSPPVNQLCFGAQWGNGGVSNPAGIIWSPRDAYQIDTKIDDGLPYQGEMVSNATGGNGNCVTSNNSYNLKWNDNACRSCFTFDLVTVNGE